MSNYRQTLGRRGEEAALAFLSERGFCVVARNYRCRFGEIDLVGVEREHLVFVEVKSRASATCGSAEEAFTWKKRRSLWAAAVCYLGEHPNAGPIRFDLVTVSFSGRAVAGVGHYPFAMGAGGEMGWCEGVSRSCQRRSARR